MAHMAIDLPVPSDVPAVAMGRWLRLMLRYRRLRLYRARRLRQIQQQIGDPRTRADLGIAEPRRGFIDMLLPVYREH